MVDMNADIVLEAIKLSRDHWPTLLLNLSIILSAVFPIVTGAHASLSRPASAAPWKKEKRDNGLEDEDEEEEILQPMESLSASDAIMMPILAGSVLATLYWLIKRYGAEIINLIMSWYLSGAGVLSAVKFLCDATDVLAGFIFPTYFSRQGRLWIYRQTSGRSSFSSVEKPHNEEASPLPGSFGRLPMPRALRSALWSARSFVKQKYAMDFYIKEIVAIKSKVTALDALATVAGVAAVGYSNFILNHWWLVNLQGFAVSYLALQLISPTSFIVGSLVLSGLFVYDIWAVFFTPLMVTVATKLDQPIKLVFPRHDLVKDDEKLHYSMLGLGDIVLPGLLIGLCLRYDLYMYYLRRQTKTKNEKSGEIEIVKAAYTSPRGRWADRFWTAGLPTASLPRALVNASFAKPYFYASMIGYTLGLAATLVVVTVYQHAQPALLYLVPAVLSCTWGTAVIRGELKQMWEYTEELTGDAVLGDEKLKEQKKAVDAASEVSWWQSLLSYVQGGVDDGKETQDRTESKTSEKPMQEASEEDPDAIIRFTIQRVSKPAGTQAVNGRQDMARPATAARESEHIDSPPAQKT